MSDNTIPLEEARRRRGTRSSARSGATRGCPVTALGHCNGLFMFSDSAGQERRLSAGALGKRSELVALFGGQTEWLLAEFPKRQTTKTVVAGETVSETAIVGFQTALASEFLMKLAFEAGIYGEHVILRRVGIWQDDNGAPVLNAGDRVLPAAGAAQDIGTRWGGSVWVAGPKTPRPGPPVSADVAQQLQADMQRLWTFREPGGAIVILGLVGVGYFGAAATWRSNGYLTGGAGSGKSKLLSLMRACAPLHHYTNETSKAGVEGAVNGRAMPIFIDESGDRADRSGAQALMDMLLAATGGDGTRGHRGTVDGGVRTINMVGVVTMASVAPPDLKPTHRSRITLVELMKPGAGEDNNAQMNALIAWTRSIAPGLWGRAFAGFERWRASLIVFRDALSRVGCAPREMDQLGSILAGWWTLTHDGVPTEREALDQGVAAVPEFVRRADEVAEDDGPQRMLQLLMTKLIQYDGSTRQEQIGALLRRAYAEKSMTNLDDSRFAAGGLQRYGLRPIRSDDVAKGAAGGRPAPRMDRGDGLWLLPVAANPLFRDTPFEGERWQFELLRLTTARRGENPVRVGGVQGRAIWIGRQEFLPDDALEAEHSREPDG